MPDGSDRDAVAEFAASGAEILGNGRVVTGVAVARIWDRASSAVLAVQMANQLGMVFAGLRCNPRWRERLGQSSIPTLVVHGRQDPFFPEGDGEALAREINGSRLLVLERVSTSIPDAATEEVAAAMLEL